jgi:hypothetical protein
MADTTYYPPGFSSTYVKATSTFDAGTVDAHFATNPANSLTGTTTSNSWISNAANTNQRFHIDLGSAIVINKVYYENAHDSGGTTGRGVNNFTMQGSNDATAFGTLTYATDTNWTNLTTSVSQLSRHVASDTADPEFFTITNTTAYRYYAFKFADTFEAITYMGMRRIELIFSASGPANIKTVNGLAIASVKTINGLAIGSVKTYNGLN